MKYILLVSLFFSLLTNHVSASMSEIFWHMGTITPAAKAVFGDDVRNLSGYGADYTGENGLCPVEHYSCVALTNAIENNQDGALKTLVDEISSLKSATDRFDWDTHGGALWTAVKAKTPTLETLISIITAEIDTLSPPPLGGAGGDGHGSGTVHLPATTPAEEDRVVKAAMAWAAVAFEESAHTLGYTEDKGYPAPKSGVPWVMPGGKLLFDGRDTVDAPTIKRVADVIRSKLDSLTEEQNNIPFVKNLKRSLVDTLVQIMKDKRLHAVFFGSGWDSPNFRKNKKNEWVSLDRAATTLINLENIFNTDKITFLTGLTYVKPRGKK